jgi:hypothetical protein
MKQIVIMPGGFHPFHAGHYALYQSALKAFPQADVYVAATNDQSERPFPFAIKEKLAKLAGVKQGRFVQVKSPFQSKEITQNYDPNSDVLIFVRSEKDKTEQPKPGGTKKDGSPAYFQPWTGKNLQPFSKHAYIAYLPTVTFGPGIQSATEIRNAWPKLDDRRKTAMVMSLYPATQKNPKLAQNVVQLLDMGMGGQESVAEGSLNEFAVSGDGGDGDDSLFNYAKMWYNGDLKTQRQVEKALQRQGLDIGENEDENGGAYISDISGDYYESWTAEDLEQGVAEGLDEACWKGYHKEGNKKMFGKTYPNCVKNTNEEQLDEKCWDTHKQVGMKNKGGRQVPNCVPKESIEEAQQCPECGGPMFSDLILSEKKDACYNKVKSRYKVWPSAYASGALVQCRKKGASNWGTGGKKNEGVEEELDENLNKWFKEKWVRFGPDGKIRGDCARGDDSEGKPKCLPQSKAHSLGKKGRASAASRKRREDPNPERSGKAINVNTKKKSNEGMAEDSSLSVEQLAHISDKALDDAYHYGRSTPGANFGWMANIQSARAAKRLIDAGETDIEVISDAIHKGWNVTAAADYKGQLQLDTPTPEDKKLKRAKLAMQSYSQLPEEEKEKDRVVARALLQAINGKETNIAESADYIDEK